MLIHIFHVQFAFRFRLTKAGLVNQCALLPGILLTSKDETARKIDQINFDYILPDGPAVVKKNNGSPKANGANKEVKSKYDEYIEGLRDYQTGQITKLGNFIFMSSLSFQNTRSMAGN